MLEEKLLEKLINIQKSYAEVFRFTVTSERTFRTIENNETLDFLDKKNREPLIEHIGHLPIIATTLHSCIENLQKIDLGKVLIMLAIHDIGETVVGDIITFKKTEKDEELESITAKKILPENIIPYFIEFEEGKTLEAKFAMSVDKLAPLLRDLENSKTIIDRHTIHNISTEIIISKKRPYFEWNLTLLSLFDLIIDKYKEVK
jgi:putative hydrolases of HD superfamily